MVCTSSANKPVVLLDEGTKQDSLRQVWGTGVIESFCQDHRDFVFQRRGDRRDTWYMPACASETPLHAVDAMHFLSTLGTQQNIPYQRWETTKSRVGKLERSDGEYQ
jgi:hypothetical protein